MRTPASRATFGVLTLLACGIAAAGDPAPPIGNAEMMACKSEIAAFHDTEIKYWTLAAHENCDGNLNDTGPEGCGWARLLKETIAKDDFAWWMEGNRSCESSEYPCFGPGVYNDSTYDGMRESMQKHANTSVQAIDREIADAEKQMGVPLELARREMYVMRCIGKAWMDHHGDAESVADTDQSAIEQKSDPAPSDADAIRAASCAEALAKQDAEFDAMTRRAPAPGSSTAAGGARALYQMGMYITGSRLELLDQFCKGLPQYSMYAPTKVSYDSALAGCKQTSSDGGATCVPQKLW